MLCRWSGKEWSFQQTTQGKTVHGWKAPLSTQAWEWLSERTTLVPQEFVLQESRTSSSGNWILAGWKNKMNLLSTPAAEHTVFKFSHWEGQCISNQWVARILLIQNPTCFLMCVLQQWTSGKEYSRRTAGHCQHGRQFKSKNVASYVNEADSRKLSWHLLVLAYLMSQRWHGVISGSLFSGNSNSNLSHTAISDQDLHVNRNEAVLMKPNSLI